MNFYLESMEFLDLVKLHDAVEQEINERCQVMCRACRNLVEMRRKWLYCKVTGCRVIRPDAPWCCLNFKIKPRRAMN